MQIETVSKFVFNPHWTRMDMSTQNAYECITCLSERIEEKKITTVKKTQKNERIAL